MNNADAVTVRDYLAAHAPTEIEVWFKQQFDHSFEPRPQPPANEYWCEGCPGLGGTSLR